MTEGIEGCTFGTCNGSELGVYMNDCIHDGLNSQLCDPCCEIYEEKNLHPGECVACILPIYGHPFVQYNTSNKVICDQCFSKDIFLKKLLPEEPTEMEMMILNEKFLDGDNLFFKYLKKIREVTDDDMDNVLDDMAKERKDDLLIKEKNAKEKLEKKRKRFAEALWTYVPTLTEEEAAGLAKKRRRLPRSKQYENAVGFVEYLMNILPQ